MPSETAKKKITQAEYLREGAFLPPPLRDFHDAKDAFKSLHEWLQPQSERDAEMYPRPTWADGQIYVCDGFLRFMAACGWTLQRSRANVEFASLSSTIANRRERESKQFGEWLDAERASHRGGNDA